MVCSETETVKNVPRSTREGSAGGLLRHIIAIALLLSLAFGLGRPALADDAATPVAVNPPSGPEADAPTPTPTAEPTLAATASATATSTPDQGSPAATSTPDAGSPFATETPVETATAIPTPAPPTLDAVAARDPDCKPANGAPAAIASGGALDFDCVYQLKLNGARLAPAWISIDWSVNASVTGG